MKRLCEATTKAGKPCRNGALEGATLCNGHMRQLKAARGEPIGWKQRAAAVAEHGRIAAPQRLTSQAELRDWFADCLLAMREGRLERLRFKAISDGVPQMREQIRAAQEPDAEQPQAQHVPQLSDEEIIARIVSEAGPDRVAAASGGKLEVIDGGKAS